MKKLTRHLPPTLCPDQTGCSARLGAPLMKQRPSPDLEQWPNDWTKGLATSVSGRWTRPRASGYGERRVVGIGPEWRGMQMQKTEDGSVLATAGSCKARCCWQPLGVLGRQRLWGLRWHPGGWSPWAGSDGTSSEPRLGSHGPRQFPPLKRTVPASPAVVGPQASGLSCAGGGGLATHGGARVGSEAEAAR